MNGALRVVLIGILTTIAAVLNAVDKDGET